VGRYENLHTRISDMKLINPSAFHPKKLAYFL